MATSKRSVRIHRQDSGLRMYVCYARTLKSGLKDYFDNVLKPIGCRKPKYVGNVLQVETPTGEVVSFVAYEEVKK